MIYIKLEEDENSVLKKKKYFFYLIEKIKDKFYKLNVEEVEDKILVKIPNIENKTLNKLSYYIEEHCIYKVCASDNLLEKEKFIEFIKNENVKLFDGKWLFKHLTTECIKYIAMCKKEKIEYQEISILSNNIDALVVDNIKEIAGKVRTINVITEKESRFRKLEKELYSENGIILNMNNNYKKSLIKSDIIFNFDFTEEEINKYNLPQKTCIVNLNNEIKINSKSFEGINAIFYEITMPRKYLKDLIHFRGFDTAILYESFIYKNTNPSNIKKELEKDNINIVFLHGKNGKIRKTEYSDLSKKIVN